VGRSLLYEAPRPGRFVRDRGRPGRGATPNRHAAAIPRRPAPRTVVDDRRGAPGLKLEPLSMASEAQLGRPTRPRARICESSRRMSKTVPLPDSPGPAAIRERLTAAIEALEAVVADRGLLGELSAGDRTRLIQ